jgi:phage shock protein C
VIDPSQPIRRSRSGSVAGGACAGAAEWLGWHPSVVRVAYFLLTAFTGFLPGVIAYAALWVMLPQAPEAS